MAQIDNSSISEQLLATLDNPIGSQITPENNLAPHREKEGEGEFQARTQAAMQGILKAMTLSVDPQNERISNRSMQDAASLGSPGSGAGAAIALTDPTQSADMQALSGTVIAVRSQQNSSVVPSSIYGEDAPQEPLPQQGFGAIDPQQSVTSAQQEDPRLASAGTPFKDQAYLQRPELGSLDNNPQPEQLFSVEA